MSKYYSSKYSKLKRVAKKIKGNKTIENYNTITTLKATKSNDFIIFQVLTREGNKVQKSNRFYIEKKKLKELEINKIIIDRDIYSYVDLNLYDNGILKLEFSFLEVSHINTISGNKHYLRIDYNKLYDFINNKEVEKIYFKNIPEKNTCKLENVSTNLNYITKDKKLKKKIRKILIRLQNNYRANKCIISNDYDKTDLCFSYYYKDKFVYNGGVILHEDYEDKNNISKMYYSIHT